MDRSTLPALPDWTVVTVRWAFLVTANLWLAFGDRLSWTELALLAFAAVVNIVVTVLILTKQQNRELRLAELAADILLAYTLFYLSLSNNGDLLWLSFLPLITAAIYFQWIGAIVLTLLNVLVQGGLFYLNAPLGDPLVFIQAGVLFALFLVVGLPTAYAGQRLNGGARSQKKAEINEDEALGGEHRRAIFNLIMALNSSLNYQKVLEASMDLSASTLAEMNAPSDRLVSAVMFFTGREARSPELSVATGRGLHAVDRNAVLPGTSGVIAHAIDEGTPALTKEARQDKELMVLGAMHDCNSAYIVPLRTGLDAYGILLFAHPDAEFFTPTRREVLDIVGNQSVIAIQNARLFQDLEQEKNRMTEIQEESRKKLARDLHDGPTQSISAIAMRVNFARRLLERDVKAASDELYKIEDLARRTTKEIRHMLFTLRPLVLESQGLVAALEQMGLKMKETYNQEVIVQAEQRVVDALETGKQAVVFYLAEEAVNNARKHAQATQIWVRLKMLRDGLSLLEIEDNGVGFDVSAVDASYDSRGSLGMINLRERSELVSGVLRIDSARGRGTRVQIVIPLTEEAADRIRRGTS
jgi:signal transduction histidine kinase